MSAVLEAWLSEAKARTVLDFGCGDGAFVARLSDLGYDAYGCDLGQGFEDDCGAWQRPLPASRFDGGRLRAIETYPYRIPFDDCSFDAVISNQVMEHVQNKAEVFAEIARVLKPGGAAVHVFPPKTSFPVEHHVFVPFASWGRMPVWWFRLWAMLGVRNQFQRGLSPAEVAAKNVAFCQHGVCYWSRKEYERLSPHVTWQPAFYVAHGSGFVSRLARRLHIPARIVSLCHAEMMVLHQQ